MKALGAASNSDASNLAASDSVHKERTASQEPSSHPFSGSKREGSLKIGGRSVHSLRLCKILDIQLTILSVSQRL